MKTQKKQNGQRCTIPETIDFLSFKKISLDRVGVKDHFMSKRQLEIFLGTQNPGRYEYPYRFVLPRNLPATYSSPNGGFVRYSVKVTVDIPMAYDYEDEKVFIVQSYLDLNEVQGLPLVSFLNRIHKIVENSVGYCFLFDKTDVLINFLFSFAN